jgi:hypothetical protein
MATPAIAAAAVPDAAISFALIWPSLCLGLAKADSGRAKHTTAIINSRFITHPSCLIVLSCRPLSEWHIGAIFRFMSSDPSEMKSPAREEHVTGGLTAQGREEVEI